MPTTIQDPTPEWMKSKNASVLDPAWLKVARWISQKLGGTDPESGIFGMAAGFETKAARQAAEEAAQYAKRFKGVPLRGQPFPTLGETLKTGSEGLTHVNSPSLGADPYPWLPEGHQFGGTGMYELKDPVLERLQHLKEIGATEGINWRMGEDPELLHAFAGDREAMTKYGRGWGAMSPATNALDSTREMTAVHLWQMEHPGEEMTKEIAGNLEGGFTMKNRGSKLPNWGRVQRGVPMSGDKVEAMGGFGIGQDRKPIDVHYIYGATGKEGKGLSFAGETPSLKSVMSQAEGQPFTGPKGSRQLYLRYEDAIRRGLGDMNPGEAGTGVWGDFWEGVRLHKGLDKQGGPVDMLRKQGLLGYGQMLDPTELRRALNQRGWTKLAIAGLMTGLGHALLPDEVEAATGAAMGGAKKPGLEPVPGAPPPEDDPSWYREDGSLKGHGYLGDFQTGFPGGPQGVASEYSVAQRLKTPEGKWMDYPSLVPGLTPDEVTKTMWAVNTGHAVPPSVGKKAEAHALQRISQGRSVWADTRESPLRIGNQVIPQPPLAVSHQQPGLVPVDPNEVVNPNDMPGMAGVPLWLIPR